MHRQPIRFYSWYWDQIKDDHQSQLSKINWPSIHRSNVQDKNVQAREYLQAEATNEKHSTFLRHQPGRKICSDKSVTNLVGESWETQFYTYLKFWTWYYVWNEVHTSYLQRPSDVPINFIRGVRLEWYWFWPNILIIHTKDHHEELGSYNHVGKPPKHLLRWMIFSGSGHWISA